MLTHGGGEGHLSEIRRAIEILQETAGFRLPYYRSLLAEACGRLGRTDEGLEEVSAALAILDSTNERWWEPELHRLRGELLTAASRDNREAETCFKRAIEVALKQRAVSLELRATLSLARLWQRNGKRSEAIRAVARIYDRFGEGAGDADLREARAVIGLG
jgi:predicted ATPase